MDIETWRRIPGWPWYEASNLGRIRSITRMINTTFYGKPLQRRKNGKIIQQHQNNDGYMGIRLARNGNRPSFKVHRLIAMTFIGPPPDEERTEINHKDGNKINNHPNNLEWVTRSENCEHSFTICNRIPTRGEKIGSAKLTEKDVIEIRRLRQMEGKTLDSIAETHGICRSQVRRIVTNEHWKHI